MNDFERILCEQFGEDDFREIQKTKIGIAGLGGLGSNAAMNLVRSGFRNFKLIDFDKIDRSNLNRQFYFEDQVGMLKAKALAINLKRINPDIYLELLAVKIKAENVKKIFADCDIVVEAFDKAEDKSMLVSQILPLGKLVVCGSGLAGIGNSDLIAVHWIKKNLVIVGDLSSDINNSHPVSPKINIAAAKQADIILEYLVNNS